MTTDQTPVFDATGTASAADAVHALMRFLRVIMHRKMYVASALLVAGLLGGLYYLTATRIYEANAQLLILETGRDVLNSGLYGEANRQSEIPTYERLFSSSVVLEGAIAELLKGPPESRADLATVSREKWVDILRRNLTARSVRRTDVIEIAYRSKSPRSAEAVVRAIVKSYLEFMQRNHKDVSKEVVEILERDRQDIEEKYTKRHQEMLATLKLVRDLGLTDKQNVVHPAVARVVKLNESLIATQQERLQLEASLGAIRAAIRDGADVRQHLTALEPVVGRELLLSSLGLNNQDSQTRAVVERKLMEERAKLKSLLTHYGEAHPAVVECLGSIRSAEQFLANYQSVVNERLAALQGDRLGSVLMRIVEEKLASLWEHETNLSRQYQRAEAEAVAMNDRMAELRIINHELDRLRRLHDTLLDRIAKIDISQDNSGVRVTVVGEPTALKLPVSPRLSMVGLMCVLGGLGAGMALAYVLDVLDDRFRSPEEIQEQLGAPVLAMVRQLAASGTTGLDALHVHVAPESVESEAFRTLRTTLAFSGQDDRERIAVTSAEPGDGKTTVLANLAVSYAQAGKRTLVIDADLRRPGLTKLFAMRGRGGLSEVLRGEGDITALCAERVQTSGVESLDVLPCGPKPSNPAELLSSPRMADVLAWAESNYDRVLVDCPPILAASDAGIVGRLTEGLMLVIQPAKNHRRLVLCAVAGLASIGVNLVGVVAKRIDSEKNSNYYGYGYGFGYGYSYSYHSEAGDKETDDDEPETLDQDRATVPLPTVAARRATAHRVATSSSRPQIVPRRAA